MERTHSSPRLCVCVWKNFSSVSAWAVVSGCFSISISSFLCTHLHLHTCMGKLKAFSLYFSPSHRKSHHLYINILYIVEVFTILIYASIFSNWKHSFPGAISYFLRYNVRSPLTDIILYVWNWEGTLLYIPTDYKSKISMNLALFYRECVTFCRL